MTQAYLSFENPFEDAARDEFLRQRRADAQLSRRLATLVRPWRWFVAGAALQEPKP